MLQYVLQLSITKQSWTKHETMHNFPLFFVCVCHMETIALNTVGQFVCVCLYSVSMQCKWRNVCFVSSQLWHVDVLPFIGRFAVTLFTCTFVTVYVFVTSVLTTSRPKSFFPSGIHFARPWAIIQKFRVISFYKPLKLKAFAWIMWRNILLCIFISFIQ